MILFTELALERTARCCQVSITLLDYCERKNFFLREHIVYHFNLSPLLNFYLLILEKNVLNKNYILKGTNLKTNNDKIIFKKLIF